MKFKWFVPAVTLASTLACAQSYADTSYNVRSVVSQEQLDKIVTSLLKSAPSGTRTEDLDYSGTFTISDSRHLTALSLSSITFKVITKILFIPISSRVTLQLGAVFPDLDCNNPQITLKNVSADNSMFESAIKDHINSNIVSIIRDNFVAQTGIKPYCKIKPRSQMTDMTDDLNFASEDDYTFASEDS